MDQKADMLKRIDVDDIKKNIIPTTEVHFSMLLTHTSIFSNAG